MTSSKRLYLIALILLLSSAASACLKATKPNLPKIFPPPAQVNQTGKRPLIVIPGILGSELRNAQNEIVWPVLLPRHRDALLLPIDSLDFAENRDQVRVTRVLERADFGILTPEIGVYSELLTALEDFAGYKRGDFEQPPPTGDRDTYYLFAYDWRRDNVEAARLLAEKIAALKQRLGRPDLRFDIIAHSMGGLIARYYALYGGRDVLNENTPRPDWSGAENLARLILLGTPNGGSMDAFRSLLRGYSVTEAHRVRLQLFSSLHRRMIFSAPSVYQLLPRNRAARFYDAQLAPVDIDFYDVETWRRYGWSSAFAEEELTKEQRRLAKQQGPELAGEEARQLAARRERFLRAALARAQAFHRALDVQSQPPDSLRLHLFGGDCEPTLAGALLVNRPEGWETLFYPRNLPGGRKANKRAFELIFLPGDGRVTRQSLFGLTLAPGADDPIRSAMKLQPAQAMFNCELHGDLPLNLVIQDNLLTLLLGNSY